MQSTRFRNNKTSLDVKKVEGNKKRFFKTKRALIELYNLQVSLLLYLNRKIGNLNAIDICQIR